MRLGGICWEWFWRPLARRACCGARVCTSCAASHVRAVLTDDSRFELLCPCCSASALTDLEVRAALRAANLHGLWFRSLAREVRRYERWSVAVALRRPDDEILRCPGMDCDVLWLVATDRRRTKLQAEPSSHQPFDGVFPTSRVWSPRLWGLYAAPKNVDGGDDRRVYCEACRRAFCALCRRSWQQAVRSHRPVSRRNLHVAHALYSAPLEAHDGRACVAFARKSMVVGDDDYAAVADAAGARACPGCSLRVDRTAGCNHITCPQCATHWCFICETTWSQAHYACRDQDGRAFKPNGGEECALM